MMNAGFFESIEAVEALKQAIDRAYSGQPKRRKPTNYTKPRNRKKKPKNKRR